MIVVIVIIVVILATSGWFFFLRTPAISKCKATSTYPSTSVGGTATAPCPTGMTGTQKALCKADGTFAVTDTSGCVAPASAPIAATVVTPTVCSANTIFPITTVGATASATCPPGFTGTQTAQCQADGTFSSTDATKCIASPVACNANGTFPTTAVGGSGSAPCPTGFTGSQTAACKADGTFATAVTTGCIPKPTTCTATATFPSVPIGGIASAACPTGYSGTQTAACNADGTFATANTTGCKAALTLGTLATPLNQEGGQIFFDRHNVACPAKSGMANFHLVRNPPNFQESYDCLTGADIGDATGYTTPAGGNLYDAGVEAKCPTGSVLNQWHVGRPTESTLNMDYKCVPVPNLGTCTDMTTSWQADGGGYGIYLDRLSTACPKDTMMSRFRLENNGAGSQRYNYTCCAR